VFEARTVQAALRNQNQDSNNHGYLEKRSLPCSYALVYETDFRCADSRFLMLMPHSVAISTQDYLLGSETRDKKLRMAAHHLNQRDVTNLFVVSISQLSEDMQLLYDLVKDLTISTKCVK
jgi:hypothetical protein